MARDNGVRIGTRIRIPLYAPSQRAAAFASLAGARPPRARGPVITLKIVGIAAAEYEFPSGQSTAYDLYTTRAFAAASPGTPALQTYYVRLRGGPAASARFESRPSIKGAGVEDLVHPAAAITTSIRPQAVGWWVLAGLTGLAALALLAQALARQALAEDGDFPVLATLGLRPRDLAGLGLLRAAVIAVIGATGGVAVAVALSPIAPLGEARLAEPAPGLNADWLVLGYGALATVVVVLIIGAAVAWRSARARLRAGQDVVSCPSAVVRAAVAAGAPASAVIGLRHALTRTPGMRALPVATALTGAVAAVAALGATAVFGASLTHLTRSPDLYGAPFQGYVFSSGPGAAPAAMLAALKQDPAISRVTAATDVAVAVNGVSVRAITTRALRGPTLLSAVQGRVPRGPGEMALGVSTLHRTGVRIGSPVAVTVTDPDGTRRTARFRVVGLVAFPGDFSTGGLGTGATLTTAGYLDVACPAGPGQPACQRSVQQTEQRVLLVRAAARPRHQPDPAGPPVSQQPGPAPGAGGPGQLRGVGQLPADAGGGPGPVRDRRPGLSADRQRGPAAAGERPAEGARFRPAADRGGGVLAGQRGRGDRGHHRAAAGRGRRAGDLAGVRVRPGHGRGPGGARLATGGAGGRRAGRGQRHGRGPGRGRGPVPDRADPPRRMTQGGVGGQSRDLRYKWVL